MLHLSRRNVPGRGYSLLWLIQTLSHSGNFVSFFMLASEKAFFSELRWAMAMVAYTRPRTRKEEKMRG